MQKKRSPDNGFQPVLAAVREASYSFQSALFMRSTEFESLIRRRAETAARLQLLSDEIVERLFDLIRAASDENTRRRLIELKRKVYNLRHISADCPGLPDSLGIKLDEYSGALREIDGIFETHAQKIEAEIENSCAAVLEDEIFLTALEYSCPELFVAKPNEKTKFSKWLRKVSTVYAYALKHVTKTAPLLTFSRIYLPVRKAFAIEENTFETVLNAEIFSELEGALLNFTTDKTVQKLEMATRWRGGERCYFLVFRDNAVKILHYPATPLLEKIVDRFREAELKNEHVTHEIPASFSAGHDSAQFAELVEKLKQDFAISSYLIENPQAPFDSLAKIDSARRETYENLCRSDGQIVRSARIRDEHRKIATNLSTLGIKVNPPYIGYSYAGQINSEQQKTTDIFSKDLSEIGDIFRLDDNNRDHRATILELIARCFKTSGKTKLPFLELLTRVLWLRLDEKAARKDHSSNISEKVRLFERETLKMTGVLSAENIAVLKSMLPENAVQKPDARRDFRTCFVGAVDFQTPSFYVHNVFAGDERFTGKYLIKQSFREFNRDAAAARETIDVEVMPAWNIPQHRVKRSLRAGFSFDRRCRQFFDETIEPEDIEVVFETEPVFFHRLTKKRLKFHYRGIALFQRLPIPYKLLLFDQTDFFINPFAQTPPRCERNETVFLDGLRYKSINLRRPSFCLGTDLLKECLAEKDWIRGACLFRERVRKTFDVNSDYLYFRLIEKTYFTDTPRFINLLHPLSRDIFRRSLLKSPASDAVHITECRPAPAQTSRKKDGNHFTEFMIEI